MKLVTRFINKLDKWADSITQEQFNNIITITAVIILIGIAGYIGHMEYEAIYKVNTKPIYRLPF